MIQRTVQCHGISARVPVRVSAYLGMPGTGFDSCDARIKKYQAVLLILPKMTSMT